MRSERAKPPFGRRLLLALLNVGLALCGLLFGLIPFELAARLVFPQPRFDPRLPYFPNMDETQQVNLPGISPEIHRTTNEWGFRGDPPPENWDETYTILTVGGSTTLCYFLDDSDTWPALLQAGLRERFGAQVWVGNAGIDGHTTRGNIVVMDEVVRELRPDMVVILVGINDLGLSLSASAFQEGNAYDEYRRSAIFESQLFRLFVNYNVAANQQGVLVSENSGHQGFQRIPVDEATLTPLPDDLADLLPSLPEYRRNLNRIIDIAEELDITLVFLTQPMLADDTPYWDGIQGTTYWIPDQRLNISTATYWRMMDIFNQSLLEVCEERAVTCYHLASAVPHDDQYFYDLAHFTEDGSTLVAESILPTIYALVSADLRN